MQELYPCTFSFNSILIHKLQLKLFQALTVAVGPRAGIRGAGCNDLSSLKWLNGIKVRGATALQISKCEAVENPKLLRECFKHAVNRQVFAASIREQIATQISEICSGECHKDRLCSTCLTAVNKKFAQEASRASAWCNQNAGINWDNVCFPTGLEDVEVFSQNNPHLCISLYRATEDKGDVYLFYRSKLGEVPRSSQKMIHIVTVSRLNTMAMELETHFLPVTNLDAFCSRIYEYDHQQGNITTKYGQGALQQKRSPLKPFYLQEKRVIIASVFSNGVQKLLKMMLKRDKDCWRTPIKSQSP